MYREQNAGHVSTIEICYGLNGGHISMTEINYGLNWGQVSMTDMSMLAKLSTSATLLQYMKE
jgi:hypothetical protein